MVVRFAKLLMVAGLAAFALIVTFDNIIDHDTNFQFVRHVLSMDTTFAGNACCTGPSIGRRCGPWPTS